MSRMGIYTYGAAGPLSCGWRKPGRGVRYLLESTRQTKISGERRAFVGGASTAPPECLEFSEGWSSFSAFGVSAFGRESIEIVGEWLEEVFVPVVMPLILDYLAGSAVSMDENQ